MLHPLMKREDLEAEQRAKARMEAVRAVGIIKSSTKGADRGLISELKPDHIVVVNQKAYWFDSIEVEKAVAEAIVSVSASGDGPNPQNLNKPLSPPAQIVLPTE